jgi:murein L,D-transpeptidase YcbB/YkuD
MIPACFCTHWRNFCISGFVLLLTIPTCAFSYEAEALRTEFDIQLNRILAEGESDANEITALREFYSKRGYQPVWLISGQIAPHFNTALAFIAGAEDHGLERSYYQLDQLVQLFSEFTSENRFVLELQTTRSLLKFMRDLYRGRYAAIEMDSDWYIPQPDFDAIEFLLESLDSGNFQQSLESLVSSNPNYQHLQHALAKFRDLVAHQVVWTRLPHGLLLKPGNSYAAIPLVRERIAQAYETHGLPEYNLTSGAEAQNDYYDNALENAVRAFQRQHGLNADGIIGSNTVEAMNRTPMEKLQQLRINLERLRWLPRNLGKRYLLVNIAGFQLTAIENGQYMFDMRIIVGREYRSTPSFHSRITHMILNPYWNVPASIARKDLLPKQQANPAYFTSQNIRVYEDYSFRANPIDPETIDWNAINTGFPYALRQEPGRQNALGTIKFMLPNDYSIYLHDTPAKSLFNKDIRTFSSGCIRLEAPLQLADFALRGRISLEELKAQIDSGKTKQINLPEPLPVYIVYLTTWIDSDQNIHYSLDTYGRDERALDRVR